MFSVSFVFLLAPVAFAFPTSIKRASYANTRVSLREDLQDAWYSDWNETSTEAKKQYNPSAFYSCAGPLIDDYPSKTEWLDFATLWDINDPIITTANNGDDYNQYIKEAIQDISSRSKVDARLILAMIMQESAGKVTVHCTGPTERDCGLMQLRGSRAFSKTSPKESIRNMITDGIYGKAPQPDADIPFGNPGYLTLFNGAQSDLAWLGGEFFWRGNPYAAAHLYNAGSISGPNLAVVDGGVERSKYYANDIASRLLGWNGSLEGCLKSRECGKLGFEKRICA